MANQGGTHEQHVRAGQQSHKNSWQTFPMSGYRPALRRGLSFACREEDRGKRDRKAIAFS